ncbi:YgaP family membrane protein [Sphingobacterium sp. LRF_L2]|uniref:YgaP family membrane protein n=1 Tax=Sphingobacterium sp. LRF_L2 TaxID=3369421 RepID=UPI003F5F82EA
MGIVELGLNKLKHKLDEVCEHGEIGSSERILSVVAGGFIVAFSIKRALKSPLKSFSGLALGTALVARGVTGKCPVKGALEKEPEETITVVEHKYFVK